MWEQIQSILSVIFILAVFIGILMLAYYATKFIGKRFSVQGNVAGNIKIIDKVLVGQDRSLLIVEAAGETMLIGVTSNHIEKLCDIDKDKLTQVPVDSGMPVFSDTLKTVLKNNWGLGMGAPKDEKREKPSNEL